MTDYIDNIISRRAKLAARVDNLINYLPAGFNKVSRPLTAADIEAAAVALETDKAIKALYARELNFTGRHYTRENILQARRWYDSLTYADLWAFYDQTDRSQSFADWLVETAEESYWDQVYDR